MASSLYRATVMHHRLKPKKHRFHYKLFLFYIDLDTIITDFKKSPIISYNRFNLFSFYDRDHLQRDLNRPQAVKEELLHWLKAKDIQKEPTKIFLLTHLRFLGYVFNPVSFFFCYDENNNPMYAVAEVSNTYREMKPYLLDRSHFDGRQFRKRETKYFYVSPFITHDAEFDFQLQSPDEKLHIRIDDYEKGKRIFLSTLSGEQKKLTTLRLLGFTLRFPFITLQVIGLIHWNAFLLWLKKIRFYRKNEYPDLQRDMMRSYKKQ
jgi:hypothetical protein